jgi:hypothetical protein
MKLSTFFGISTVIAAAAALCAVTGCRHVGYELPDAGDTDTDTGMTFEGLDFLVMIDDSISMRQEQAILATDLFAFAGSLVSPLPTSAFAAIDDLRIAVVTSNMGFSSNGEVMTRTGPVSSRMSARGSVTTALFKESACRASSSRTISCTATRADRSARRGGRARTWEPTAWAPVTRAATPCSAVRP